MALLSIIIPSRNEQFLGHTVRDLLAKAKGDIQIIPVLDGYWPNPPLPDDSRIVPIHRGVARGMRNAINSAAAIADGKYIMKVDAHCMFDDGFDIKLMADCEPDWVVIPRRKRLDGETWTVKEDGRKDIDYEYLGYPYRKEGHVGIHGTIWGQRAQDRINDPRHDIDDNMAFQGSCWFTTLNHFWNMIGGLQEEGYGTFIGEPQEIGMKTWLGGGRLVVNKKTWYAHLYKGKQWGRGYFMDKVETTAGNLYSVNYWMRNLWPDRIHDIEWLVERFWPVPSWPEDRNLWVIKKEHFVSIPTNGSVKVKDIPKVISKEIPVENAEDYIIKKYDIDVNQRMPVPLSIGRDALPALFKELGYKVGAEIGVERALYSEVILKAGLFLYAIDAWTAYKGYREHVTQSKLDGFFEQTVQKLAPYNCQIIRCFSMDALNLISDGSLDFVYIDAAHDFLHIANDIAEWTKKVRRGGIISGHDFNRNKKKDYTCHVKDVVQAWAYSHNITPWFITRGDRRSPSWFWVKE